MSERTFNAESLYAVHVPDPGPDQGHPRPESVELGAGHVEVGVVVDGARIPLARVKAGGVFKKIEAAKRQREQSQQQEA